MSQTAAGPGFGPTVARRIFIGIWVALLAFQAGYLFYLDNNLSYLSDSHAEADTLRAADAYLAQGLGAHHGLARILYGNRFPTEGTVKDHVDGEGRVVEKFRQGFPSEMQDRNQWVLTHYPPGADLINGLQAEIFGTRQIWPLRLLPVIVGLIGLAWFFKTVSLLWGVERGALIALAIALLPMVSLWLPTLHHEGYAFALILIQASLLLKRLWGLGTSGAIFFLGLFLCGFVQGCLSWDFFFMVSLLAIPWWLLRRAEGENPPLKGLFWMTAVPAIGYALAHILHAWEVAAELHGWGAALHELLRTGAERAGFAGDHMSRLGYTARATYLYLRLCLKPFGNGSVYGPFFGILILLAVPAAVFSATRVVIQRRKANRQWHAGLEWPGKRSPLPALVAAFLLCFMWLLAMPEHVVGNAHYTVRHMAVFYIALAIVVARSLQIRKDSRDFPKDV